MQHFNYPLYPNKKRQAFIIAKFVKLHKPVCTSINFENCGSSDDFPRTFNSM